MLPLLRIENLSLDFVSNGQHTPALRHISFTVNKGEIVALVGESGSGKSVTSLSILQLLPAPPAVYRSGSILFAADGKTAANLLELSPSALQKIRGNQVSMIFQEPMTSLNPVMTCGRQVMEALQLHKKISQQDAREKTLQWFERVKLPNPQAIFNRYPHQLSGGQKQRVMIAMAMCCEPSLLICDEPTTALDVTVQKTILQLIKELQQQTGMGVIFITHDLGVVAEIADRTIVMYKGEIAEEGTVAHISNPPAHPYTTGLLACRPVLHPKNARLPVVADFLNASGSTPPPPAPAMQATEDVQAGELLMDVRRLSVWFPATKNFFGKALHHTRAVDDVSFPVYKGETLGLVGESGCGKTTLGRTLLQLIPATSGEIIYAGKNMADISPKELHALRKEVQIVFQDPYSSLNPRLDIGSAIAEPMKVHGLYGNARQRKEKAVELLEKVDLKAEHYSRYPHEFSGGQRQRIVIARALALQPSFIVCDESVSALDVSVQAQVLNLLNDLKKELQLTIIFISHDLSVVHYISDRIIVMNKGKIEETGSAHEVFNHPQMAYTQQLIASIPRGLTA